MTDDSVYKTSDFSLAVFLFATQGVELVEIAPVDARRVGFTFRPKAECSRLGIQFLKDSDPMCPRNILEKARSLKTLLHQAKREVGMGSERE